MANYFIFFLLFLLLSSRITGIEKTHDEVKEKLFKPQSMQNSRLRNSRFATSSPRFHKTNTDI